MLIIRIYPSHNENETTEVFLSVRIHFFFGVTYFKPLRDGISFPEIVKVYQNNRRMTKADMPTSGIRKLYSETPKPVFYIENPYFSKTCIN